MLDAPRLSATCSESRWAHPGRAGPQTRSAPIGDRASRGAGGEPEARDPQQGGGRDRALDRARPRPAMGIDETMIAADLRITPEQRLRNFESFYGFAREIGRRGARRPWILRNACRREWPEFDPREMLRRLTGAGRRLRRRRRDRGDAVRVRPRHARSRHRLRGRRRQPRGAGRGPRRARGELRGVDDEVPFIAGREDARRDPAPDAGHVAGLARRPSLAGGGAELRRAAAPSRARQARRHLGAGRLGRRPDRDEARRGPPPGPDRPRRARGDQARTRAARIEA